MYFRVSDENHVTGETKEVDLVPNGAEIKVTNQNKFRYIYMMADYRLNRRIKAASDAFVSGFHSSSSSDMSRLERETLLLPFSQFVMIFDGDATVLFSAFFSEPLENARQESSSSELRK